MTLRKLLTRIATMTGVAGFLTLNSMGAMGASLDLRDVPLFLNQAVPPFNMLVMERDHKLYYEAYNDHSDLNDDGVLDIRFDPAITYFGYFSSTLCYEYNSGVFEPERVVSDVGTKTCGGSDEWSGNWLNYVTTSRIDALRKVLYGGRRSTDDDDETILERSHIPQDAHAWGKEYTSVANDGYDIRDYTPYDAPAVDGQRHLFANVTLMTTNSWTTDNGVPRLRVLLNQPYRIWEWVSIERPVAGRRVVHGASGPDISASIVDFTVRVEVCVDDDDLRAQEPSCQRYPEGNYKPVGLLQQYGENDRMLFGLLTGSYERHLSGGVLRRNIGSIRDEINPDTGQFQNLAGGVPGVIGTMNRLRMADYSNAAAVSAFGSGTQQACGLVTTAPITQGQCRMWGNPIGEMMYETLRYFAGKTAATTDFATSTGIDATLGLPSPAWTDPYASRPVCSKPFMTVLSDINPSYDTNQVPGSNSWPAAGGQAAQASFTGDITGLNASTEADAVWSGEGYTSANHFIGQSGATYDGAPTPKTVTAFSNIRGLSPEEPTKQGGFYSAGVAYWGNTHDVNANRATAQKVQTFVVALASPLPRIDITTDSGGKVTIVPFGKSVAGNGPINGAQGSFQPTNQIVDFYVESLTDTNAVFQVNFEDVESGNDHDMDAIVKYDITKNGDGTITISTYSVYAAGSIAQHMGYVISGTNGQDGIYLEVRDCDTANNLGADPTRSPLVTAAQCRGNNPAAVTRYFLNTPPGVAPGKCAESPLPAECDVNLPLSNTRTFTAGSTSGATILKDPLWFAAKWGGFQDRDNNNDLNQQNEWDEDGDGTPDNYFLVTNALTLGDRLSQAFTEIEERVGSASSVSVNSGSISSDTRLFQAKFNSGDWTGQLLAFPVNADGTLEDSVWDAADNLPDADDRAIITRQSNGDPVAFRWDDLDTTRQGELEPFSDGFGEKRLGYLRGSAENEQSQSGGVFRTRTVTKLGDIVASAPRFVGAPGYLYPDSLESEPYSEFRADYKERMPMVYSGANDGMLHGFDATTGIEKLAYIPSPVFKNLHLLTDPGYAHKFFVDGPPNIVDAFFGGAWHTVLTGGLNRGGQGIYALDVTSPDDFAESGASDIALWEFTDSDDADLGYTFSRPVVTRLANGKWVAIFGNGYNNTEADDHTSTSGNAVLYIVDVADGSLIRKIDTGKGSAQDPLSQNRPNGLATPSAVDIDGDSVADYVYAGDLFGNLWKFNLRNVNPAAWGVSYTSSGNPAPLYIARNEDGDPQPITSRPEITRGPRGAGLVVVFGTGKFLEPVDRDPTNLNVMTFYGLYDRNTGGNTDIIPSRTVDAAALVEQSIVAEPTITITDAEGNTTSTQVRVTTQLVPGSTARGWFLDLVSPSGFQGEMQVSETQLRAGKIIFTTLIPDPDPCAYGGSGWIMALDAVSGSRLLTPPFDFNNDGKFDDTDLVTVTIDGNEVSVPASGRKSEVGITPEPGILAGNEAEYLYNPGTTGAIQITSIDPGKGGVGRQSWRQIR